MLRLADDPALRRRLGEGARRRVEARFDARRLGEQLATELLEMAAGYRRFPRGERRAAWRGGDGGPRRAARGVRAALPRRVALEDAPQPRSRRGRLTDPAGGYALRMPRSPVLLGLLAAALFGAATPASKRLLIELTPLQLAGLLYLGAALGVAPAALRRGAALALPRDRRNRLRLAARWASAACSDRCSCCSGCARPPPPRSRSG